MKKIGILEDDIKMGEELKYFLESNGYEVRLFGTEEYSGQSESFLVDLLTEEKLHILLLDIGLPGIDGTHICKAFRSKNETPVIMITSNNSELTELLCITNGADDFVPKPFNPHILLARIETIIKRVYRKIGDSDCVSVDCGDNRMFQIDFNKAVIISGEDKVELSKNELQILKLLVKKHGEVVSRDDIIDYLWDNKAFVDDNTLTVNMSRIKSKLESVGISDVIVTKRGMGYQLV